MGAHLPYEVLGAARALGSLGLGRAVRDHLEHLARSKRRTIAAKDDVPTMRPRLLVPRGVGVGDGTVGLQVVKWHCCQAHGNAQGAASHRR